MNPNNIRIRIRSRKHYSLTSGNEEGVYVGNLGHMGLKTQGVKYNRHMARMESTFINKILLNDLELFWTHEQRFVGSTMSSLILDVRTKKYNMPKKEKSISQF